MFIAGDSFHLSKSRLAKQCWWLWSCHFLVARIGSCCCEKAATTIRCWHGTPARLGREIDEIATLWAKWGISLLALSSINLAFPFGQPHWILPGDKWGGHSLGSSTSRCILSAPILHVDFLGDCLIMSDSSLARLRQGWDFVKPRKLNKEVGTVLTPILYHPPNHYPFHPFHPYNHLVFLNALVAKVTPTIDTTHPTIFQTFGFLGCECGWNLSFLVGFLRVPGCSRGGGVPGEP